LFELTPGEKRRRKEVALSGLPKVVMSTKSGIRLVNEVHEFMWQFERHCSPLSEIAISMNCVCVAQNGVVKLYDGLVDAWSETPNFMDYIYDDDDNIIMVVRRGPMWSKKDINSKPIKMGVDVLKIVLTWENPKTLRGTFESQNSQKQEVPVLLNRIEDAFPAVVSRSGGSETNLSVQYYEVGTQKIVLNSGIFAHLIMNDPVMGFLYHIMKARNNTVIKLNRRDEKNSSVHFYQLPSGYVGIYFQAPTGKAGENILEKIISSLMYYEEKKKEVENLYLTLGIQGQNMLSGLNIDPSTPAISIVEEIDEEDEEYEEDEEDDDEIALRKTLDIATAMQNNPGISFKTLRSLSMSKMVYLNPRRWGPAAAIGNNVDLYMLSNDGLIVPHSKNGLYTRQSESTHAVILFISEDEVFLIGKWDVPPIRQVNLDYKKIKGKNMVGCVPSAVNTVLTGHDVDSTVARYYIQSVKGGDGKVGFLKCIEFAKSNDSNFLFRAKGGLEGKDQLFVPADAVIEHISTIFQQMTIFFSGASVPVPGSADGGKSKYQVVDGSGKFCGTRSRWEKADAPFPQKKVKSLRREGVVHKFMSDEQISSFLSQICLYRFSIFLKNDENGTIDAFALSELKEGKFEKLKSFSYNLSENFKDEKIIVPSVENIKFELSQAMKNPQFVKNYHTATHLLGFFRKGAYHDKNSIVLPVNQFSQWAMAWKKPNDTFVHKPIEQLEEGRTYFISLQRRLARAVNHTSFQNAKEYLTNKKVLAPALIIYDGNFSENMYTQKGAIVGWKNNGKFFFTSIIFV
jgi:hypothetical protein